MQAKGTSCHLIIEKQNCFGVYFKSALLFQQHRKVLDKGKPDDIMPAVKGAKVRADDTVISFHSDHSGLNSFDAAALSRLTGTITNSAFIRNVQQVRRKS